MREYVGGRSIHSTRRLHFNGKIAKVWQREFFAQQPPLAWGLAEMRRAPQGASSCNSGMRVSVGIEELFGFVAAHPISTIFRSFLFVTGSATGTWWARTCFYLMPANFFRPSIPSETKYDHWPARTRNISARAGALLIARSPGALLKGGCHFLMHHRGSSPSTK